MRANYLIFGLHKAFCYSKRRHGFNKERWRMWEKDNHEFRLLLFAHEHDCMLKQVHCYQWQYSTLLLCSFVVFNVMFCSVYMFVWIVFFFLSNKCMTFYTCLEKNIKRKSKVVSRFISWASRPWSWVFMFESAQCICTLVWLLRKLISRCARCIPNEITLPNTSC